MLRVEFDGTTHEVTDFGGHLTLGDDTHDFDANKPPQWIPGDASSFANWARGGTAGAYTLVAPSGAVYAEQVDAPSTGGGAQSVEQAQVTLSSADILALADTPKVLVPGAAGVIHLPMAINVTPGAGTPYTVGTAPDLYSDANAFSIGDSVQYALANGVEVVKGIAPTGLNNSSDSPFDSRGSPLYLQVQEGANPTGGTLAAVVTLLYASLTDTT